MSSPCCAFRANSAVFLFFCLYAIATGQLSQRDGGRNETRKLMLVCPEMYRRIGNGCYHLGEEKLSWHEAGYSCADLGGGYLAKLDRRWKDRSVKRFLNRSDGARVERWLGTIYDFGRKTWMWGAGGEKLTYQGFSRRRPRDNYSWRCGVLDPIMLFRWGTRSCFERKAYICEVPIKIVLSDQKTKKTLKTRSKQQRKQNKSKRYKKKMLYPDIETNRIT